MAASPSGKKYVPNMTSQSGFWTRSSSDWGSLKEATSTLLASAISDSVRWRMKTGLPRHLMMTFLPSGMAVRSTSTLAMARTSAEADMFLRNSGEREGEDDQ